MMRYHALERRGMGCYDSFLTVVGGGLLCFCGATVMPRVNRNEIFADDEIQVFHLVNRCVRRTYLCGRDDITGRDYSHRKQWIRDRLEVLAGILRGHKVRTQSTMHLNGEGWVVTIRFSQLLVGVCCVFVERRSCHG